ncbi:MAG: hypothetical protein KJN70_13650 [Eudoraea sp.]|nr:hypothetical protein [Eudoraea sp.]
MNKKSLKYLKGFLILILTTGLLAAGYLKLKTTPETKITNRDVVLSSKLSETDKKPNLEVLTIKENLLPIDSNGQSDGLIDKTYFFEKNIPEKCSGFYTNNNNLVTECYKADVLTKKIQEETLQEGIIIITENFREDGSLINRSIVEEGTDDEFNSYIEYDRQGRVIFTEISRFTNDSDEPLFRQSQIIYQGDIKKVNISGDAPDGSIYESEMVFKAGKPIHLEYQDHKNYHKRVFNNQGSILERIEYSFNSLGEIEDYKELIYDYNNNKLSSISLFDEYGNIECFKEIDIYKGGSSIIRLYYSRDGSENINPDEINISGGTNTTKLIVNPASGIIVNQSESSATGKSWVGYGWLDVYDLSEISPKTVFEN